MIVSKNKLMNNLKGYILINSVFLLLNLLLYIHDLKFFKSVLIITYVIYVFLLKEINIVENQVVLMIIINVFYDIIWRKTSIDVPLDIKYLVDFISIIALFKITLRYKKYSKILKDKIFLLLTVYFFITFIISMSKNIELIDYIMSLRIYIRFTPIYIILSTQKIYYSKFDFNILILVNLFLALIQSIISFYDDVSGIFGISNVQTLLLFMIIVSSYITVLYSQKEITLSKYIFSLIAVFFVCGIGEIKIGLVFIPIIIIFTLLLNSKNIFKIVMSLFIISTMIITSVNIIKKVSPEFVDFFRIEDLESNITNYVMKSNNPEYQLGRLENIFYTNNYILLEKEEKIMGLGIGSSMPSDTYYYELPKHSKGRERIQLYSTELFEKYGPYFGYHFSSMNLIYLENGYIGILLFFIILLSSIITSFRILSKSKDIKDKFIIYPNIMLMFSIIPLFFYYNYILNRSAMMLITIVMALNKNRMNLVNEKFVENLKKDKKDI